MMIIYESNGKGLSVHEPGAPLSGNCVWIDLLQPTPEEDKYVEDALAIDVPTRAEMREIEPSNRFYQERGAYFMTASIVYNVEAPVPETTPVTFILAGDRLVTVRYAEPKAFPLYLQRVEKGDAPCTHRRLDHGRSDRRGRAPHGRPHRAHPGRRRPPGAGGLRVCAADSRRATGASTSS